MAWSKPETAQIQEALRRYAPHHAKEPIEFLAEGWECWSFVTDSDLVLRFPKRDEGLSWLHTAPPREAFSIQQRLLPELAKQVTTRIPDFEVFGEGGPNGAPFAGYRLIPGELAILGKTTPAPSFGDDVGRFIRELQAFPAERAVELGVPLLDGKTLRQARIKDYEDVIRRIFPIVSCEARTHIERLYEANLNDPATFDFEPRLLHQDIDWNTLIDPETGEMTGVIDFGNLLVSNPAMDLWLPLYGFKQLGIESQLPACLEAAEIDDAAFQRMQPELAFLNFRFPLLDILHGLDIAEEGWVREGIEALNKSLPADLSCGEPS